MLYVLSGFLLVIIGRTVAATIELIIDQATFNVLGIFLVHLSNELLNLVLGLVAFMVLRNQKEIMLDMNDYLLQLAEAQAKVNQK